MAVRRMLVAGRYRLREPVGTGGMGRVWLARDEMLDRDVAVKEFVPPEWMTDEEKSRLKDRTLREARSAARLNHPNVVQIYDVVHFDGQPWIVMEYVPSRSLHQVLNEDGAFAPRAAARIGLHVLDALTAAHRAGVLHRDIKPHNVLIGEDGRVVLTDFGLATFVDDGSVTGPGLIVGSPQYVSPERARDGASTVESDLWSFGATLYAAVEGRSPYARESAMATLMALATEPPDEPAQAGLLVPVLTGLLRHDPGSRLTATEVDRRLRMILAATEDGRPAGENGRVATENSRIENRRVVAEYGRAPAENGSVVADADPAVTGSDRIGTVNGSSVKGSPVNGSSVNGSSVNGSSVNGSARNGGSRNGVGRVPSPRRAQEDHLAAEVPRMSGPEPVSPSSRPDIRAPGPALRVRRTSSGPFSPAPAGADDPSAEQSADRPKSRSRLGRPVVVAIALSAVALLGAGGIVAGYVIQRNDPPARVVLPVLPTAGGRASSAPAPAPAASAIGGFTPAACSGPAPANAPRTPQKNAVRGMDASQLYPGWSYFTDGTFHLPVPDRWTYQKVGTTYCFRDPNGVRMMILDTKRKPTADPVAACRVEAKRVVDSRVLPGYHLISIGSRPLLEKAADWEYTYRGPDDTAMHVDTRWEVLNGKAYAIAWVNDQSDWSGDFAKFQMVLATFLGG